MSLVTVLLNKNKIEEKLKNNINLYKDDDFNKLILDQLIRECLLMQYHLLSDHLAKNSLNKRNYKDDLSGNDLVFSYYTHHYKHNNIALNDECLETITAYEKYMKFTEDIRFFTKEEFENKLDNKLFLILEEIIDMFHFILQYNIFLEEHMHLTLLDDDVKNSISQKSLSRYISNDTKYNYILNETLKIEAAHINTYLLNELNVLNIGVDKSKLTDEAFINKCLDIFKINQDFVRTTAFKDWKNYENTYYTPAKFTELFNINRLMYKNMMELLLIFINKHHDILVKRIEHLFNVNNYFNEGTTYMTAYKYTEYKLFLIVAFINAIYMSKNEENIRRQKEDPRYTGRKEGNILGVKA